ICFDGYEDIQAGIVNWPMSVIRLCGADPARIADLADKILTDWRGYTDESVGVIAFSDGQPHNTITPIARRRGEDYELDLVLRCNITSEEHPLGVFHPHADKHNIKKENIGLIEVMGLAVLPSRLKQELADLAEAVCEGRDITKDETLEKHAVWVDGLKKQYTFTKENALDIILKETGKVFAAVLEDAGVYKNTPEGMAAFLRFVDEVNKEV
ncbi:MAG: galactose-1-phosphate uridylyltransferase, partial [Lachnospiraceae bacterium]|nr:galactose-1-phosphate uridylyltransferase [Lachnospiraceae bacterium]